MGKEKFIVITTIGYPTQSVKKLADICEDWNVLIVADKKTPSDWFYPNTQVISVQEQLMLDSSFAKECPWNHYARKNIGYIKAIQNNAEIIYETDDDNIPKNNFPTKPERFVTGKITRKCGWENVYKYFTNDKIWPRGFPLEYITQSFNETYSLGNDTVFNCPVQQYLVDGNPDVDAVFRLTNECETKFNPNTIILGSGTFCPFNSQNTIWWPEAYPLLYLPSFVSFRMTDIWRSFIAQVCLYQANSFFAFRESTMYQIRNVHSLIRDFEDEIPGYLNNIKIMEALTEIKLSEHFSDMGENLRLCYKKLVEADIIPEEEIRLVDLWLDDVMPCINSNDTLSKTAGQIA